MNYYKSVRCGKRVRRTYFGGGVLGQIAEAAVGPRREESEPDIPPRVEAFLAGSTEWMSPPGEPDA